MIRNDRLRDEKTKEEDLIFLEDQKDSNKRKMTISKEDLVYQSKYDSKEKRRYLTKDREEREIEVIEQKKRRKEESLEEKEKSGEDSNSSNEGSDILDDDMDFNGNKQRTKKPESITLQVPRKIICRLHWLMQDSQTGQECIKN